MLSEQKDKVVRRKRRSMSVRKRVRGTESRPRLSVIKTNLHIYAQMIDDESGNTLGSVSTLQMKGTDFAKKGKKAAKKLGEMLAEIAREKNIQEVVFDRGHFKYHGILAEFADAARGSGLKF